MKSVVSTSPLVARSPAAIERPTAVGRSLYVGDGKFLVKGVTYGTFRPDEQGNEYKTPDVVIDDFDAMAKAGINSVRTYTVPPLWLLDIASDFGLRVMVGIPWEQHVAFLEDPGGAARIEQDVRHSVRSCEQHPAVLCYVIGNEIPGSIVRWSGRKKVERFLERLYQTAKQEDPGGLVTYVNFPTTEYLRLPFIDLVCFNVYLESRPSFESYVARLHNLADERPLLIAEIGLDSLRNGETEQAQSLTWQVGSAYRAGCSGVYVYAWTDEWFRGGYEIEDWDFGLTTRDRRAKPALRAVAEAFAEAPFETNVEWPRISVVVCSLNGEATIRDTLDGLQSLEYPDYEVVVVDDGSTDGTSAIASQYPFTLISIENRGLSSARNTGIDAATGEIVAFIDDDAYPDPDWLSHLAMTFIHSDYVGVGGPNLAPFGDGAIADCVSNAPGGPVHVLLSDTVAEHIPGCNMAFRRATLTEIQGFDPIFRAAGDDVDVCWRLQERGHVIGFNAAAVVWHHRRNSVKMYWKQQIGYGKAEAMLERKWPAKYNRLGHTTWGGRLYGAGLTVHLGTLGSRVYQGVWGSAPFQVLYHPHPNTSLALVLMPEWYLLIAVLIMLTIADLSWLPTTIPALLLGVAAGLPITQALISASRARFSGNVSRKHACMQFTLTALLHLLQPAARLLGRFKHGLTPWRRRGDLAEVQLRAATLSIWRERSKDSWTFVDQFAEVIRSRGAIVAEGGDYDDWDLEVRGGLFGSARLLVGCEDHAGGKQHLRLRISPRYAGTAIVLATALAVFSAASAFTGVWLGTALFAVAAVTVAWRTTLDGGLAAGMLKRSAEGLAESMEDVTLIESWNEQ